MADKPVPAYEGDEPYFYICIAGALSGSVYENN